MKIGLGASALLLAAAALGLGGQPSEDLDTRVRLAAPRVLERHWANLTERQRARFTSALARAVGRDLGPAHDPDDVDSIVRRYRKDCERMVARYSVPYLIGELEARGVVVLEDFEDGDASEGGLPRGWRRRSFGDTTKTPYRVVEEDGNRFLRAEDRGENVMLYKEARWDARKYPYLGFRFRIRAVPEGSDERSEERADSAAGLYLSYRRKLGIVPETVKFVWSGSVAVGTAFRRPGIGMPWTVVAGSGEADESRWQSFVYHIGDVYESTFGNEPPERPLGIGILTDANSTGGFASADYDDVVALERADSENRILEILTLPKD